MFLRKLYEWELILYNITFKILYYIKLLYKISNYRADFIFFGIGN